MDIAVILDSSESVGEANWRQMEVFVESLIDESKVPDVRFVLECFYCFDQLFQLKTICSEAMC